MPRGGGIGEELIAGVKEIGEGEEKQNGGQPRQEPMFGRSGHLVSTIAFFRAKRTSKSRDSKICFCDKWFHLQKTDKAKVALSVFY